jgi:hypothetical protein
MLRVVGATTYVALRARRALGGDVRAAVARALAHGAEVRHLGAACLVQQHVGWAGGREAAAGEAEEEARGRGGSGVES